MDRRSLLKSLGLAAGAALLPAWTGIFTACKETGKPYVPLYFSPEAFAAASAMADRILPETDTPGALAVGVPVFIDLYAGETFNEEQLAIFKAGLDDLNKRATDQAAKPFAQLPAAEQDALLTRLEEETLLRVESKEKGPFFFTQMKDMVVRGFCTSEYGATQFLAWEDVPGRWEACMPYEKAGRAWANV